MKAAGRALGRQIVVSSEREFEGAFAKIVQAGAEALLVSSPVALNTGGPGRVESDLQLLRAGRQRG